MKNTNEALRNKLKSMADDFFNTFEKGITNDNFILNADSHHFTLTTTLRRYSPIF
jgi:hypothetical protein